MRALHATVVTAGGRQGGGGGAGWPTSVPATPQYAYASPACPLEWFTPPQKKRNNKTKAVEGKFGRSQVRGRTPDLFPAPITQHGFVGQSEILGLRLTVAASSPLWCHFRDPEAPMVLPATEGKCSTGRGERRVGGAGAEARKTNHFPQKINSSLTPPSDDRGPPLAIPRKFPPCHDGIHPDPPLCLWKGSFPAAVM